MIQSRVAADAGARDAGRDGGARLGDDGHRRHASWSAVWGRTRSAPSACRSMLFLAVGGVRDGAAARASTRSWRRRSARGASTNATAGWSTASGWASLVTPPMVGVIFGMNALDAAVGTAARGPRAVAALPRDPHLEPAAAALLRRVPALSPGDEPRPPGDVRAGRGQHRQRRSRTGSSSTGTSARRRWACAGSAYATLAARIFMAGWLLIVIVRREAHVDTEASRYAARDSISRGAPAVRGSGFPRPGRWSSRSACSPPRPRSPAASRPRRWRRIRSR